MDIQVLRESKWKQKKKSAELWHEENCLLSMNFSGKKTKVHAGKRTFVIEQKGFWNPRVVIYEGDELLLVQKHIGFWGSRNEIVIGQSVYVGKTRQGMLYNVEYTDQHNVPIVSYALTTAKWKADVEFTLNSSDIPEQHTLLLFLLGYYTVRNVLLENSVTELVVVAAGS